MQIKSKCCHNFKRNKVNIRITPLFVLSSQRLRIKRKTNLFMRKVLMNIVSCSSSRAIIVILSLTLFIHSKPLQLYASEYYMYISFVLIIDSVIIFIHSSYWSIYYLLICLSHLFIICNSFYFNHYHNLLWPLVRPLSVRPLFLILFSFIL